MINFGKIFVAFAEDDYGRCGGLAFIKDEGDRGRSVLQADGIWHLVPPDKTIDDTCGPTIKFNYGVEKFGILQSMMDMLWEKGIRPQDKRYPEEIELLKGQMKLQDNHLQDMRKLVFKK